jgi:hypothetical protein
VSIALSKLVSEKYSFVKKISVVTHQHEFLNYVLHRNPTFRLAAIISSFDYSPKIKNDRKKYVQAESNNC